MDNDSAIAPLDAADTPDDQVLLRDVVVEHTFS